jgi:hypothetical protein
MKIVSSLPAATQIVSTPSPLEQPFQQPPE